MPPLAFRLFSSLLLVFILSILPAAAGTRLAAIHRSGELRIGLTGDYRPFSATDPATGEFEGLDAELGRSLAEALGAKAGFVKTSWPNLTAALQALRECGPFPDAEGNRPAGGTAHRQPRRHEREIRPRAYPPRDDRRP